MSSPVLVELLRGKGAHADPVACIDDLPFDLAARHAEGFPHSIAQLVFHMNYWMDYELRRIRGQKPAYPEHNAESFPPASSPTSADPWDQMRRRFAELLNDFSALTNSSPEEMHRQIDSVHAADQNVSSSLEAVLWQMVAHNSYHVGQIAMIRRMLGAWPPRAGGDTW